MVKFSKRAERTLCSGHMHDQSQPTRPQTRSFGYSGQLEGFSDPRSTGVNGRRLLGCGNQLRRKRERSPGGLGFLEQVRGRGSKMLCIDLASHRYMSLPVQFHSGLCFLDGPNFLSFNEVTRTSQYNGNTAGRQTTCPMTAVACTP